MKNVYLIVSIILGFTLQMAGQNSEYSKKILAHARAVTGSRYFMQDPETVAREAVIGLFSRKFRIIPGWHNKVFFVLVRLLPGSCVRWILEQAFDRKDSARSPSRFMGLIFR